LYSASVSIDFRGAGWTVAVVLYRPKCLMEKKCF